MSIVNRKQIGDTMEYGGHRIVARHLGPDLLCEVDGVELPNFYENVNAVRIAGEKYIDQIEAVNK